MKTIVLSVLFLLPLTCPLSAEWELVRHKGVDYVTVRSIKDFYRFDRMEKKGKFVELEHKTVKMRFTIDGNDVFMNNVKFVFSFKIIPHKERYLVSRVDLGKLIDPVLRPRFIPDDRPVETVIIDPGHGGQDPGSVNRHGTEKEFALAVARLLRKELEVRRFKVVMTREEDRKVALDDRVEFANGIENAVYISIHFAGGGRGRVQGIKTYTLSPVGVAGRGGILGAGGLGRQPGNDNDSANIALATAVHAKCLLKLGRMDLGIRRARFSVLTGVEHPAILVEGGYMSHAEEGRLIAEPAYQKALARSIAEAVVTYRLARRRK